MLGKTLGNMLLGRTPQRSHKLVDTLGAELRARQFFGCAIHTLHTYGRGVGCAYVIQFGVYHTYLAAEETRFAEHNVFASHLNAAFNPLYALKPQQFDASCAVGCQHRKSRLGALANPLEVHHAHFELDVGGVLSVV